MVTYVPVPQERVGLEFDEFLCLLYPGVSKGFLRRAIREGDIEVVGAKPLASHKMKLTDVVAVHTNEEDFPARTKGGTHSPTILFEDERVLVIDKPAGMAVEPERWDKEAPCVSGMLLDWAGEETDENLRPRLAHRIDKDTSGVLLVAKDLEAERELRMAFENRTVNKVYWALVDGEFPRRTGKRCASIACWLPSPNGWGA